MNTQESPLAQWGILKNTKRPVVIAGPCSAETADQVLETARGLKEIGVEIFRAGIWKPRTRPNSFEGVGSVGLEWLKLVKSEVGLLTATEVANVKHVYEALRAGVDILWVGARTSANPFAMQEVADALKGVDIPVLVKNPVNPDVELWIGAVERILNAGLTKVGAIHRGFSSFEKTRYRNVPQWQLPIEFRRRMPEIPMICDPSHISGCTELLQEVSQKALDLNFDGLIIESHRNPKEAWSDAKQQLTPADLGKLLNSLVLRDVELTPSQLESLDDLRLKIDKYDADLLKTLGNRMKIAEQIGQYKKEHNITILQPTRWDSIINKMVEKGAEYNLSADFLSKVFKAIHQESINKQSEIMNANI